MKAETSSECWIIVVLKFIKGSSVSKDSFRIKSFIPHGSFFIDFFKTAFLQVKSTFVWNSSFTSFFVILCQFVADFMLVFLVTVTENNYFSRFQQSIRLFLIICSSRFKKCSKPYIFPSFSAFLSLYSNWRYGNFGTKPLNEICNALIVVSTLFWMPLIFLLNLSNNSSSNCFLSPFEDDQLVIETRV